MPNEKQSSNSTTMFPAGARATLVITYNDPKGALVEQHVVMSELHCFEFMPVFDEKRVGYFMEITSTDRAEIVLKGRIQKDGNSAT